MAGEGLAEPAEFSDEQLYWMAYGHDRDSGHLFVVGGMLDDRIDAMLDDFHQRAGMNNSVQESIPQEEALTLNALQLDRYHVDDAYGERTGYRRKGCSLGAPVRYRS